MTRQRITDSDIASATRGLQMDRQPRQYLENLIDVHSAHDMFASRVIVEAARQQLAKMGVEHADT